MLSKLRYEAQRHRNVKNRRRTSVSDFFHFRLIVFLTNRVATGVRKIIDYQFFSPYYRLIIDFSILYRLILSTSIFRIFCPEIDLEPDSQPNQTFILISLLISECGMTKKLKWGSVYMFITNSLYFVFHLDGYVQRIFKTFKIID